MGRARRLAGGTRSTGLAIEYVQKRRLVRLLGWLDDQPIAPFEIPVDELCGTLGINPLELGAPRQFLLFAGSHSRPAGGLRDLTGTFDVEETAWAAFRELRQGHPASQGWAELACIDGLGHVTQLAWFGLQQPEPGPDDRTPPAGDVPLRARIRALHRPVPKAEPATYLRVVRPS